MTILAGLAAAMFNSRPPKPVFLPGRWRCPICPDTYWRDDNDPTWCFVCGEPGVAVGMMPQAGTPHIHSSTANLTVPPLDEPLVNIPR